MVDVLAAFGAYQRVRGLSPRTIARRAWSLGILAELVAPRGVLETSAVDLETFLARWPSAQSRYSIRADVAALFRWARRRELVAHDPTTVVDPPRVPTRLATPIPAGEVRRLIDGAKGRPRRAIMLAALAGLRVSEAAALEGRDLEPGVLVVRNGKGGRDRAVPMAAELAAELAEVGPGPVLGVSTGGAVGAMIRRELRRAGISGRPHDLRHSFGTEAARAAGGNLQLVAQLLGHASVVTTQRYVRWFPDGAAVVADLFPRAG